MALSAKAMFPNTFDLYFPCFQQTFSLAFISFWRAASIVLSDLASSAFYAGGIAEQAVGRVWANINPCLLLFSAARSICASVWMTGLELLRNWPEFLRVNRSAWKRSCSLPSDTKNDLPFVITVEPSSEQAVREAVEQMSLLKFLNEPPLALPIEPGF